MRKNILKTLTVIVILFAAFALLLFTGIIWRSPKFYNVKEEKQFAVPIMTMEAYDTLGGEHVRPYIYKITKGKGAVYILGIEHTKDKNNAQIATLTAIWNEFKPDVAFVEGRLGFLFSGLQNPVTEHGEGGQTVALAKSDNVPFYSWEPQRTDELKITLAQFPAKHVALFYALRPYFSDFRFGKPKNPDAQMEAYISSRTDFDGIRGAIKTVAQVDSIWKKDFPGIKDWRDTSDQYGWPEGYLSEIFSLSNQIRDIHMCSAIAEEVNQGKKVFVTMGSSHAFRIEKTLRHEFEPKNNTDKN